MPSTAAPARQYFSTGAGRAADSWGRYSLLATTRERVSILAGRICAYHWRVESGRQANLDVLQISFFCSIRLLEW